MAVSSTALGGWDRLAEEWRDLEARAGGSFFLSSAWIGCWLAGLPDGSEARLLRAVRHGRTVALGVLVRRRRSAGLSLRRLWLHETGDRSYDRLTIEYNGLLVDRDGADQLLRRCFDHLLAGMEATTELRLSGITETALRALREAAAAQGRGLLVSAPDPTYGVDLDAVRRSGGDYLASLRTNTRSAVRRAIRLYEAQGPLRIHHAATEEEGHAYFDALARLHQTRWQARGEPGAFADPRIVAFHRRLIGPGVRDGALRLSRITAGEEEVGYLYNFVWRGRVLYYQGGFHYVADNRKKPGLVSHCLAISDALARGDGLYDFMAGHAPYKLQLGVEREPIHTVRVLPSAAMAWVLERLRTVRTLLRRRSSPVATAD
ncbi:GNAT family N-acetyltransferase [Azospirillum sp. sgz302134]